MCGRQSGHDMHMAGFSAGGRHDCLTGGNLREDPPKKNLVPARPRRPGPTRKNETVRVMLTCAMLPYALQSQYGWWHREDSYRPVCGGVCARGEMPVPAQQVAECGCPGWPPTARAPSDSMQNCARTQGPSNRSLHKDLGLAAACPADESRPPQNMTHVYTEQFLEYTRSYVWRAPRLGQQRGRRQDFRGCGKGPRERVGTPPWGGRWVGARAHPPTGPDD
jgi:hypothetical protein